jgi:hypothetical protein
VRTSPMRMVRSTPRRICWPVSLTEAVSPRTSRSGLPGDSAAAAWEERRRVWEEIELGGAWRRRIGRDDEGRRGRDAAAGSCCYLWASFFFWSMWAVSSFLRKVPHLFGLNVGRLVRSTKSLGSEKKSCDLNKGTWAGPLKAAARRRSERTARKQRSLLLDRSCIAPQINFCPQQQSHKSWPPFVHGNRL